MMLINKTLLTDIISYNTKKLNKSDTSKWNKIEHKLFSFISINWKGKPLTNYEVIINLIASTKTRAGLKVFATLDDRVYQLKRKVSNKEMEAIYIILDEFHGEWNYTIKPNK